MIDSQTSTFEMAGLYGGFVFTEAGKRRMLLRESERECLLKVPRVLRRRIVGNFRLGEAIRVAGLTERDEKTGVVRRIVSKVLPGAGGFEGVSMDVPAADATRTVVRVCSKKNCWRQGGRELWLALERELAVSGRAGRVEIRQVGCLDRCKQAPNADVGDRSYSRCPPHEAAVIITRASR